MATCVLVIKFITDCERVSREHELCRICLSTFALELLTPALFHAESCPDLCPILEHAGEAHTSGCLVRRCLGRGDVLFADGHQAGVGLLVTESVGLKFRYGIPGLGSYC